MKVAEKWGDVNMGFHPKRVKVGMVPWVACRRRRVER
jgi:hypothetical protein